MRTTTFGGITLNSNKFKSIVIATGLLEHIQPDTRHFACSFRNDPSQPALINMGSSSCYGVISEATPLYLTLPANQQSDATGPWISFRSYCNLLYPPFYCQQSGQGFTGPLEIRAQRHVMYPDCGNFSQPNSVQHVLFQGARLGPYNAVEWENTSLWLRAGKACVSALWPL